MDTSTNDRSNIPAHLLEQVTMPAPGPPIASVPVWAGRPRRLRHSLELRNSFALCRGCEMQCAYAQTMGCNASGADANWQLHGLNEVRSMRDDPQVNGDRQDRLDPGKRFLIGEQAEVQLSAY